MGTREPIEHDAMTRTVLALAEAGRQITETFEKVARGELPPEIAAAEKVLLCEALGRIVRRLMCGVPSGRDQPTAHQRTTRRARRRSTKETTR